ncbi:FUSC family protein [Streptomyces sp. NPDC048182]|uniref:FUSC family protein n=1 Tax=Streptomyces sp. NPDC048182 TaxID=3365507 RepID=UPI003710C57C
MPLSRHLPPPKLFGTSVAAVSAAVVPVGVAWWLAGSGAAQSVYLGMVFMTVAVRRLSVAEQCWVGLAAGAAAAAGTLVSVSLPGLLAAVVVACAAQWAFNRRSVGVAALLPSNLVLYSVTAPGEWWHVALATWLGAAVVIALAAVVRLRVPPEPAPDEDAVAHAAALACGCVLLVLATHAFGLPRGTWAVLTLCLVFVPAAGQTRTLVLWRGLGTAAGAAVAVAVAAAAPVPVCLVLAAVAAVLTVAYALMPDDLLYAAFLTATVLLLFSSGRAPVTTELALQRLEMTALGGALAIFLTLAVGVWAGRRRRGRGGPPTP